MPNYPKCTPRHGFRAGNNTSLAVEAAKYALTYCLSLCEVAIATRDSDQGGPGRKLYPQAFLADSSATT